MTLVVVSRVLVIPVVLVAVLPRVVKALLWDGALIDTFAEVVWTVDM